MNNDPINEFFGKVFTFVFVWAGVQYLNPELSNGYTLFIAASMLIIYYSIKK